MSDSRDAGYARPQAPAARAMRTVAVALWVPLAVTLLGWLPHVVSPWLDSNDRALVWIAGDDAALERAAAAIASQDAFVGGATRRPGVVPDGCPADAMRLHVDIHRSDEAQTARVALEEAALAAGARVCASHRFQLGHGGGTLWLPLAASLVLPLGLLALLPLARPAHPHAVPALPKAHAALALAAALGVVLLAPLPGPPPALPWLPALAMALLPPLTHELAFRRWLIPHLRPQFGPLPAFALSVAASVAAAWFEAGFAAAMAMAAIAITCSVLFLHTRSTAACVAAHLALAALARLLAG